MSDRLFNSVEIGVVSGSAVFGLTNITTILGIIVLLCDVVLIGFKIYQAVKTSLESKNEKPLEEAIEEAKEHLENLQNQLKEQDNAASTSKE